MNQDWNIKLTIGYGTNRWFTTQAQLAEFLGIKNSSKKAIEARCRVTGKKVEFLK